VRVQITTAGVNNALIVPVTALVGTGGGGFAVERVTAAGVRETVPVKLGLFDDAAGMVQVTGRLTTGDRVVVPSS
jgi:multidrug efflux pump subunit AcrA (membrane-fusion protein)